MELSDMIIIASTAASMMAAVDTLKDQDCKALLKECAEQVLAKAGYELTEEPGFIRPITEGRAS